MARIRSIKPEFFDSPSTAACTPWARLLYVAMWCLADDWGVGPANMKELAAFAFPNDDQWTSKELPSLCKEVADHYQVMFYTNAGRRYFEVPSWDEHQVTQRKAKRRNPVFDDPNSLLDLDIHEKQGSSLSSQGNDEYGTGEQGTGEQGTGEQGTGEQGTGEQPSSSDADASDLEEPSPSKVFAPEARPLCDLLVARITGNGGKTKKVTERWLDSADKLIRIDGYTPDQVASVINWCQDDSFWKANILSMPKLREKFEQLKLKMLSERENPHNQGPAQRAMNTMALGQRLQAEHDAQQQHQIGA